ncbi:MAG: hypothetical protein KAI66_20960, partial [Lentisphaeria bacterium]|nr:hypothetical protein [Lentisphaeria bacterium]
MTGTRDFSRWFRLALCCVFAVLVAAQAQQAGDGQPVVKVNAPPAALQAELRLVKDKQRHKVSLIGRDSAGLVIYQLEGSSRRSVLKPSAIRRAKMKFSYDKKTYRKAVKARDWSGAGLVIARGIRPILPFLDLKDNNGVGTTLRA